MPTSSPPISVYYHTHWDREWYWPFRQYQVKLAEVVDAVLDRIDSGLIPCFMLDGQTIVVEDYLEFRPQHRERLKQLVSSGKINVGPWYVLPDEFLVSGESLVRNLQFGLEISEDFGCTEFTGYMPDSFGHPSDMPMIFKKFGIESGITWRGANPQHSEFIWQSANGDSLFMYYLAKGYGHHFLHEAATTDQEKSKALSELVTALKDRAGSDQVLLPVGCDHLGPPTAAIKQIMKDTLSDFTELNPPQFLNQLRKQNLNGKLQTITGDLKDNTESYTLQGVYSSRLYLKQHNRVLEHALTRQLEPLLAITQLMLPNPPYYPEYEMRTAWKTLIQNHPHDSICGCSVDVVHFENETRFENVLDITETLSLKHFHHLSTQLAAPSHWIVMNTGDMPYTGPVRTREMGNEPTQLHQLRIEETTLEDSYVYDFNELPMSDKTMMQRIGWIWAEDVPPHGFKIIPRNNKPAFTPATATDTTLENEFLKVMVEADGSVTVLDKETNKTYRQLHTITSRPEQGDSYNSAPVPNTATYTAKFEGVGLVAEGPLVAEIDVGYTIAELGLPIGTVLTLHAGSKRLDFETHFTNTMPDHKLQVWFKTEQPVWGVDAERHFGIDKRTYDPNYSEEQFMPVAPQKELKTNTGPVQRFFSTNGQSFITQGLTEYDVQKMKIGITLMRGFGFLSRGDTGVRGAQAGPPFPTPDGQCVGRHVHCHYSWLPTPPQNWQLYDEANRFYNSTVAEQGRAKSVPDNTRFQPARSLITWDNPHIVTSATQWDPRQKGLVLRLVNTTDQPQTTTLSPGFAPSQVYETDFAGKKVISMPGGAGQLGNISGFDQSKATLELRPNDVTTLVFALN